MRSSGSALKVAALVLISVPALLALQGCKRKEEGPLEKAGKAVDRTAGKIGDVFKDK